MYVYFNFSTNELPIVIFVCLKISQVSDVIWMHMTRCTEVEAQCGKLHGQARQSSYDKC